MSARARNSGAAPAVSASSDWELSDAELDAFDLARICVRCTRCIQPIDPPAREQA
jgi:hypothetical protein